MCCDSQLITLFSKIFLFTAIFKFAHDTETVEHSGSVRWSVRLVVVAEFRIMYA